jgi:hypothetical protein
MEWTHIYDLTVKIGVIVLSVITFTNTPYFEDYPILLISLSLAVSIFLYLIFLRTLGSYLYCRINLKMPVSLDRAKALNDALSPNPFSIYGHEWLHLKEVKYLDDDKKYATALQMLEQWRIEKITERKKQVEDFKNASPLSKAYQVAIVLMAVVFLLTSFLNIPPASYVIRYYCQLFDTDEYSPILIGCLMILAALLPILLIKKMRGSR